MHPWDKAALSTIGCLESRLMQPADRVRSGCIAEILQHAAHSPGSSSYKFAGWGTVTSRSKFCSAPGGSIEAISWSRRSRRVTTSSGDATHSPGGGSSATASGGNSARVMPALIRIASFSALQHGACSEMEGVWHLRHVGFSSAGQSPGIGSTIPSGGCGSHRQARRHHRPPVCASLAELPLRGPFALPPFIQTDTVGLPALDDLAAG